jgi:hypothetical protein
MSLAFVYLFWSSWDLPTLPVLRLHVVSDEPRTVTTYTTRTRHVSWTFIATLIWLHGRENLRAVRLLTLRPSYGPWWCIIMWAEAPSLHGRFLSQMNSFHILQPSTLTFISILFYHLRARIQEGLSYPNCEIMSHLFHACYILRPFYLQWFNHHESVWRLAISWRSEGPEFESR